MRPPSFGIRYCGIQSHTGGHVGHEESYAPIFVLYGLYNHGKDVLTASSGIFLDVKQPMTTLRVHLGGQLRKLPGTAVSTSIRWPISVIAYKTHIGLGLGLVERSKKR